MHRAVSFALSLLALVTVFATQARADTIVVTGTASVTRSFGPNGLSLITNLSGPGFSAAFGGSQGFFGIGGCVGNCTAGSLTTNVLGLDLFGTFSLNGNEYRVSSVNGPFASVSFSAPAFAIPPELYGASGVRVTAPFVLTGDAFGSPTDSVNFTGSGAAVLLLRRCNFADPGQPCFTLDRLDYVFGQSTQGVAVTPTPEPATLLMLGTGLAGVVGAARRRRKAAGGGNS
jgi:hypothetical protein